MRRVGYRAAKRVMDVVLAGCSLIAVSPLLALAALAVKLESPGPALFGHERVGRGGRRFTTWKLRTMVHGAAEGASEVTAGGDPRVTRVGRLLRALKLDELPQLWNVLRGEMSLVGPRPEVPRYVALFAEQYRELLMVRPGITDPASIAFRHEAELVAGCADPEREYVDHILPEKLRLSSEYVSQASLGKDLRILLRTIWYVLVR